MTRRGRRYELIEERLAGMTLPQYVERSRDASMSWRAMAADLHEKTGVKVSYEMLRRWFVRRLRVKVTVS